jgi:NCS2 family nucleobase:cation symporter-2
LFLSGSRQERRKFFIGMESNSMPRKPVNLIYGVEDRPPWGASMLLGLQQVFVLSVAFIFPVIIINEIGGSKEDAENLICMAMIATGLGTILQALNTRFIGSGYLCPSLNGPAFVPASILAGKTGGLSLIFGMTAIGGIFETLFSGLIRKMRAFFPTEVTGTVILMIGVEITSLAIPKLMGVDKVHQFPSASPILLGLFTLFAIIACNTWGRGKIRMYSFLIGIIIGYTAAWAFGILTPEELRRFLNEPVLRFPQVGKFGLSFELAFLLPFIVASLSSALKTMGDLTTCQKINDQDWKRPDMGSISRGILSCGICNIASGLLGALGQSVSSSNIGLSIATGATSRRIAYCTGGILIAMAFLPKISALFVIMPTPIMGASLIFSATFMIVAGIQVLTSRMLDTRKTFVIGLSLIFGLSTLIHPALYQDLPPEIKPLFSSSMSLAAVCGILLNIFFRLGIARKKRLKLVAGVSSAQEIFTFMETQGSLWGARREVIANATAAMTEFMEAAARLKLSDPAITMDTHFDEFNLDIRIAYRGDPFGMPEFSPSREELLRNEEASLALAGFLIRQHADTAAFEKQADMTVLALHYEH